VEGDFRLGKGTLFRKGRRATNLYSPRGSTTFRIERSNFFNGEKESSLRGSFFLFQGHGGGDKERFV